MAIEALLAVIEREAAAEAERIHVEARRQARELEARAAAEADRRRAQAFGRLEAEGRGRLRRELAGIERRGREATLLARARLLERVFAEADRTLAVLPLARYHHRLEALVEETLRYLEDRPAVLSCPPDAAARLGEIAAARPGAVVEPREDARAGVVGRSRDGAVTVDNTLSARLQRRRDDLAVALAARLEEAGPCAGTT
jgi:vacuolar-type H+-ATPase subunit E/Vma4